MLRKAMIATAAAAMIGAGALVGTTTAASAGGQVSGSIQFGGPGWNVQIGNFGHHRQRVCTPIVKTVKYWKWGRPHWRQVVVGYDCHRRGPHHGGPHYPGPWLPGWGW